MQIPIYNYFLKEMPFSGILLVESNRYLLPLISTNITYSATFVNSINYGTTYILFYYFLTDHLLHVSSPQ